MEIINEKPISMSELKDKLAEIKKRDTELTFRGKKTEEYLNKISKFKKYEELQKDLEKLDIPRLKDRQIAKIIDILPIDIDSLRTTLVGENLIIKQEDLVKIVDTVKKYVK